MDKDRSGLEDARGGHVDARPLEQGGGGEGEAAGMRRELRAEFAPKGFRAKMPRAFVGVLASGPVKVAVVAFGLAAPAPMRWRPSQPAGIGFFCW